MGETTGISWTDGTINFWKGCTKISPACANCYMYRDAARYGFDAKVLTRCKGIWKDLLNPKKFLPGKRYFVSSWTDFFHEAADEWREEAWATMAKRQDVTFQILTKRTERIADHLPPGWPWPNVWMGATVENQEYADKRIPELLQVPAAVHFVSGEPLLGPIEFDPLWLRPSPSAAFAMGRITPGMPAWTRIGCYGLKLVITGGESGPNARPSHPDWFRSLRDQCQAAGTAFHFKQHGEWVSFYDRDRDDPDWRNCPKCAPNERYLNLAGGFGFHGERVVCVRRVGVKAAGRLLDGESGTRCPK